MYYNKRLHPRQAVDRQYVEHKHGCVLRELTAPVEQQKVSRYSSMSSLDYPRRRLTSTGSTGSGSTSNLNISYSLRDYCSSRRPSSVADSTTSSQPHNSSLPDSDDSYQHATVTRKISDNSLKNVSFSRDCVDNCREYDSPERIIAQLFPESIEQPKKYIGNHHPPNQNQKLRKGSVDSYLNKSKYISRTPHSSSYRCSSAIATKRKSLYRPDSLSTLDQDFQNLKYEIIVNKYIKKN